MTNKTNYDLSTFSKEGKIEDVKLGTKIWFMSQSQEETDVGIITRKDGEYRFFAYWERDGLELTVSIDTFNDIWGVMVENKQEQTKHKYYDVIVHWAQGGDVEFISTCSNTACWIKLQKDEYPYFNEEQLRWRIKPKTQVRRYRTALLKNNEISVFTSELTLEDAYGPAAFLRWIDPDWKEIEVEI